MNRNEHLRELEATIRSRFEDDAKRISGQTRLAVRSFELLQEYGAGLDAREKAGIWGVLAKAIHRLYPDWRAVGPYEVADGGFAYWGGIPRAYVVVFRPDGNVFMGKREGQPGRSWNPEYDSMETLQKYLERQ